MPIEFDITLTAKDMYRFNIYQAYSGSQGWLSIFLAVFAFMAAWVTRGSVPASYTALYAAFGVVFLLYLPVSLSFRAKHSLRASEVLSRPLHYAVGEEGFAVSQGEENAVLPWGQIYKLVATKSNVLVYGGRRNAYVIPREQLGGCYGPLVALAREKLPRYRVKIKRRQPGGNREK